MNTDGNEHDDYVLRLQLTTTATLQATTDPLLPTERPNVSSLCLQDEPWLSDGRTPGATRGNGRTSWLRDVDG